MHITETEAGSARRVEVQPIEGTCRRRMYLQSNALPTELSETLTRVQARQNTELLTVLMSLRQGFCEDGKQPGTLWSVV